MPQRGKVYYLSFGAAVKQNCENIEIWADTRDDIEFRPRKISVRPRVSNSIDDKMSLAETDNASDDKLSNPLKFADKFGDAKETTREK